MVNFDLVVVRIRLDKTDYTDFAICFPVSITCKFIFDEISTLYECDADDIKIKIGSAPWMTYQETTATVN